MATKALVLLLALSGVAHAQIDLSFRGYLYDDLRYVVADKTFDQSSQVAVGRGFDRNETRLRLAVTARAGEDVKGVGDVELVWTGFSRAPYTDMPQGYAAPAMLGDLSTLTTVDPVYLQAYAAYIDLYRVLPGLDLRLGRQIVTWGTADKFSPTNNLNSLDLEDPLRFGQALANDMVRADWNRGDFIVTAVWVPIFRPARLPRTAPLGLHTLTRMPFQQDDFRHMIAALVPPDTQVAAYPLLPPVDITNSQVGAHVQTKLHDVDLSLSYYNGRFDVPVPVHTYVHLANDQILADVTVGFPRMQVVGFDAAGSLAWLWDLGWWAETAVVFPQEIRMGIDNGIPGLGPPRFLDDSGRSPLVVDPAPYFKGTFGLDHTPRPWLYLNAQYVHGFIDEFGGGRTIWRAAANPLREVTAPREGNYVVAGADFKFRDDKVVLRLFGVFDFDDHSAVAFPQLILTTYAAVELSLGAFLFIGDPDTKFGDPAAGGSQAFARAKISW